MLARSGELAVLDPPALPLRRWGEKKKERKKEEEKKPSLVGSNPRFNQLGATEAFKSSTATSPMYMPFVIEFQSACIPFRPIITRSRQRYIRSSRGIDRNGY